MSISSQISSGFKVGAMAGLALGLLPVVGFGSLVGMLSILYLNVAAPGALFFLETLSYTTLISSIGIGGFTGGTFARNTKDTWMSIGIGITVGAITGFFSFIGIVMALGAALGAMSSLGLAFIAIAALATLTVTSLIGSLIGGAITNGLGNAEIDDESLARQQQTKSNISPLFIIRSLMTLLSRRHQKPCNLNTVLSLRFKNLPKRLHC
ncbi:hypothetical protein [uncultured Legionella sp.]|mgnify:CR=1 FL=1|uniref:hypothetical protein n=1 Tax=uncultured Legionella sp. TaxID=210934 RepID=UPI002639F9CB|nr:hypothetical protein [uncultured Legionella sp.]